ncbi:hypothetical protein GVAV_001558 [Gurleya vavrai]
MLLLLFCVVLQLKTIFLPFVKNDGPDIHIVCYKALKKNCEKDIIIKLIFDLDFANFAVDNLWDLYTKDRYNPIFCDIKSTKIQNMIYDYVNSLLQYNHFDFVNFLKKDVQSIKLKSNETNKDYLRSNIQSKKNFNSIVFEFYIKLLQKMSFKTVLICYKNLCHKKVFLHYLQKNVTSEKLNNEKLKKYYYKFKNEKSLFIFVNVYPEMFVLKKTFSNTFNCNSLQKELVILADKSSKALQIHFDINKKVSIIIDCSKKNFFLLKKFENMQVFNGDCNFDRFKTEIINIMTFKEYLKAISALINIPNANLALSHDSSQNIEKFANVFKSILFYTRQNNIYQKSKLVACDQIFFKQNFISNLIYYQNLDEYKKNSFYIECMANELTNYFFNNGIEIKPLKSSARYSMIKTNSNFTYDYLFLIYKNIFTILNRLIGIQFNLINLDSLAILNFEYKFHYFLNDVENLNKIDIKNVFEIFTSVDKYYFINQTKFKESFFCYEKIKNRFYYQIVYNKEQESKLMDYQIVFLYQITKIGLKSIFYQNLLNYNSYPSIFSKYIIIKNHFEENKKIFFETYFIQNLNGMFCYNQNFGFYLEKMRIENINESFFNFRIYIKKQFNVENQKNDLLLKFLKYFKLKETKKYDVCYFKDVKIRFYVNIEFYLQDFDTEINEEILKILFDDLFNLKLLFIRNYNKNLCEKLDYSNIEICFD